MDLNRRNFLRIAGTVYLSAGLPVPATAIPQPGAANSSARFPHGVASGDPLPDSILLWTRVLPSTGEDLELVVQLSIAESFSTVLLEESVTARADQDFTVRVEIDQLDPGRTYFYRFITPGGLSRTGRTMTAPDPSDARPVHLAFASCQNYEQGFYGAWARMVAEDRRKDPDKQIQFVLHLGDFIYERYSNRAARGQRFVRTLPAFPDGATDGDRIWAHTLADYRHLYKSYLADPHLQAARARWPFVCTWDDHEFSNDGFRHFSTYGDEPLAEPDRHRDAIQAWFEYIPARVPEPDEDFRIYRKLRWGKHSDILLTDLRSYRSGPPLPHGLSDELGMPLAAIELVDIYDGGRAYNAGEPPEYLPFGDGTIPNTARKREPGTMMGDTQKNWFKQAAQNSGATWKVWGNSLPILHTNIDLGSLPLSGMHDGILSEDAWPGFPGEYRELMSWMETAKVSGLVSLSGDHHMQGAGTLVTNPAQPDSPAVAVDFNVTGISSTPHYDNVIYSAGKDNSEFMQLVSTEVDGEPVEIWNMCFTHGVLAALAFEKTGLKTVADWLAPNNANPGLAYLDTNSNGYGLASFDEKACRVRLVTVVAPLEETGQGGSEMLRSASFELPLWKAGETISLTGPVFTGTPPFPW
jgi:alkaline phosphatase D